MQLNKNSAAVIAKNEKIKSFAVTTAKLDNAINKVYNDLGDEK